MISSDEQPEPYILTKEEEDRVIEHEINSEKQYVKWKMEQLALTKEQIDFKISEINWEERIDRQSILQRTNSIKNHTLWLEEKHRKDKEEEKRKEKELKELWTAKMMYRHMAWVSENIYRIKLIVKDQKKEVNFTKFITALCFFVSRDERFESELGYSLNKGLLIRGISGLGKTHLVKCLEQNSLNPIKIISMLDVADSIRSIGEYIIEPGSSRILYLDDVGTEEPTINHYGTKINFFKNFIEGTYLRTTKFNHLMFSTNNSFDELEEKYGFRVRSRFKDMFNVIDVYGKDMRG